MVSGFKIFAVAGLLASANAHTEEPCDENSRTSASRSGTLLVDAVATASSSAGSAVPLVTVIVNATSEAIVVSTDVVTVTSCLGSNIVSCHFVSSTTPAALPPASIAAAVVGPTSSSSAVTPPAEVEAVETGVSESGSPTTIVTVLEGATITVNGFTATDAPAGACLVNGTVGNGTANGAACVSQVPVPSTVAAVAESNGQTMLKASIGGSLIAVAACAFFM
jgi:hypothetical protein